VKRVMGVLLVVALSVGLGLIAVAQQRGGQLTISFGHHSPDVDLAFTPSHANNGGWPVLQRLFEWKWDNSEFVPLLASCWEVSEDSTTYTVTMRGGVKWHDGTPFTAEDVLFSWNTLLHPDVPTILQVPGATAKLVGYDAYKEGKADSIAGISIVDGNKVEFKLKSPDATFINELAWLRIIPKHLLEGIPPNVLVENDFWQNPIGTGPFKFERAVSGEYMEFVRWDDYYLGAPYLDRLIIRPLVDGATRVLRVESGETDVIEVPPDQIEYLQGFSHTQVVIVPSAKTRGLEWVHVKPDIGDPRVRTAIMKALDVPTLVDTIIGPGGTPTELFTTGYWQLPEGEYEPWGYDPQGAMDLLEEARQDGTWTDREIEIQTYYPDPVYTALLEAMQGYLAAVGIDMTLRVVDDPTHINEFYVNFTTDAALTATWGGPDPSAMADMLSSANLYPAGWNGSFSDPRFDMLLDWGATEGDQELRREIYWQLQRLAHEVVPMAPMWNVNYAYTVPTRAHNVYIGPDVPKPHYKQAHLWWVDQ